MKKKVSTIHTIGRRKTSTARVFLQPGTGAITVNAKPYEVYFGRATAQMVVRQPLNLIDALTKFDINVLVSGGGLSGQAGAVRHAISRALETFEADNRKVLKAAGLLTRDPREVERKKYGKHGARRSTQFSKR